MMSHRYGMTRYTYRHYQWPIDSSLDANMSSVDPECSLIGFSVTGNKIFCVYEKPVSLLVPLRGWGRVRHAIGHIMAAFKDK